MQLLWLIGREAEEGLRVLTTQPLPIFLRWFLARFGISGSFHSDFHKKLTVFHGCLPLGTVLTSQGRSSVDRVHILFYVALGFVQMTVCAVNASLLSQRPLSTRGLCFKAF